MTKNLKSKQEYIDRYDRFTVEDCRRREASFKRIEANDAMDPPARKLICDVGLYFDLLHATLQWYERKEGTVNKWMQADQRKDQMLEGTSAPERIRCLRCGSVAALKDKVIYDWGDENNFRVLFVFSCANGCLPHRAFFDDGKEHRAKLDLCVKCQSELKWTHTRTRKKIVTTYICPKCDHTYTDELDLVEPAVKPDPDFLKDRERFCLTKEEAERKREEKWRAEQMNDFMNEMKERDKCKELYAAIALLKKLTIIELEKLLVPRCEKVGYIKFQFGCPDMGKNFTMSFTALDSKTDRVGARSANELQKNIKKALENTNWRLMSDGVTYRLGILTGRLRAYELKEDLLHLVELKLKKKPST